MSRIYFHSQHGTAEVRGSERAWMGVLCSDIAIAALGPLTHAREWLTPLITADWERQAISRGTEAQAIRALQSWINIGSKPVVINGEPIEPWLIALNTAMALGNDAIRLFARLHAQCEVHCWIDGPNRKWLAAMIRQGREDNLLREEQGWEATAVLLESHDDGPVVCSYSVCSQFPNPSLLPADHPTMIMPDEDRVDAFWRLPEDEKWTLCMSTLRATEGLELRPDNWTAVTFHGGANFFSMAAQARQKELRAQRGKA